MTDQRARAVLDGSNNCAHFSSSRAGPPLPLRRSSRVRVIVFASAREYQPYRLRATADAYYGGGTGEQDYIVIAGADAKSFSRRSTRVCTSGSASVRLETASLAPAKAWPKFIRRCIWTIAAPNSVDRSVGAPSKLCARHVMDACWRILTALPEGAIERQERSANDLFYAESWASDRHAGPISPYASHFPRFIVAASDGAPGLDLLLTIYGKSVDELTRDLHAWVGQGAPATVQLPRVRPDPRGGCVLRCHSDCGAAG